MIPLDPQVIFDTVLDKLRVQGCASIDPNTGDCLYRGPEGRRCAAGWLIPDHLYNPNMEGKAVARLPEFRDHPHRRLLSLLQFAHDYALTQSQELWEERMRLLAARFALTYIRKEPDHALTPQHPG